MPHCFVLQSDGKYAIWSTIVDDFLGLDMTREEALDAEVSKGSHMYPGGPEAYRDDIEKEFGHIEKSGIAWDWAPDWNEAVRWCRKYNPETIKIIDELGLPHRMKRRVTPLKVVTYWRDYWRNKAEALQCELRKYQKGR